MNIISSRNYGFHFWLLFPLSLVLPYPNIPLFHLLIRQLFCSLVAGSSGSERRPKLQLLGHSTFRLGNMEFHHQPVTALFGEGKFEGHVHGNQLAKESLKAIIYKKAHDSGLPILGSTV